MFNQFRRVAASMLAALLIGQFPLAQAETRSYQHDNSGNFTQCSVTIGNSAPAITNYTYDALNRLQTESGPNKIQTITYDEDGNRLSDGAGSYTYSTTTNWMLTRLGATVITDLAGHVTADGTGRTFTYNQAGQLSSVSKNNVLLASYYYDADGRRSHKVTTANAPQGAQSILYDYDPQGNLWYEIDATTNTPIRTYFWNPDSNAPIGYADYKPSRKIFYFAADHLKTPRMVMDDTGKVVWRWESDAFGSTPANEDPDGDGVKVTMNLRFPGQYYDQESGLHYNYHRYYDPAVGRYTQADPIGIRGGLNGYAYVEGNPLRYTDPDGLLLTQTLNSFTRARHRIPFEDAARIANFTNKVGMTGAVVAALGPAAGAAVGESGAAMCRVLPETIPKVAEACKNPLMAAVLGASICGNISGTVKGSARSYPRDRERIEEIGDAATRTPRRNTGNVPTP